MKYVWQTIDINKQKTIDYSEWPIKKQRKKLATKFKSLQQSGRYVHVMDDEMLKTLLQMLESHTDIQIAKNIIWNSKMNEQQMRILINKYTSTILNDNV